MEFKELIEARRSVRKYVASEISKAEARGPMTVKEWGDAERLAGWREIAKGVVK